MYCGYRAGRPVLHVPRLRIPRGKLTFIVGVSGGGKSTLLETLGLMNRTILRLDGFCKFFPAAGAPLALDEIWEHRFAALDDFRKKNYSFIFQKTNLIPNFTCGENMMLPALFKGERTAVARGRVLDYMDRIGLPAEVFDKHVSEISGGQRQRVSFIRAMAAEFTVLFGDEPTGNLDAKTAAEVLGVLAGYLAEHGKTGIVVSHDIGLATRFADVIIPIELTSGLGTVHPDRVLHRAAGNTFSDGATGAIDEVGPHLSKLIAG